MGRILIYMLDIWFPPIIKLPVSTWDNFVNALEVFWQELFGSWLAFLLMAAVLAFLISFRPWPFRLKDDQERVQDNLRYRGN